MAELPEVRAGELEITPSLEAALEHYPPELLGPVWEVDENGDWYLPTRTLGWEILGWVAEWLQDPDGGPWLYTDEQVRFILWFYAIDDRGQFIYRNAVLQRMKGWGKDPVGATLCIVELIGPSRFSHFDADGDPVAKRNNKAWIAIAAVNESQTKNTMFMIPSLLPERTREAFNLDVQKELVQVKGAPERRIECLSTSFRSLEGKRLTFCILNETHHWIPSRNGDEMYRVLKDNLVKTGGRFLAITNAFQPGEASVAEDIRVEYDLFREGLAYDSKLLYDSLEAHPDSPMTPDWAPFIVQMIRGDAVWLNDEIITTAIVDGSVPVAKKRRMWYNQILSVGDSLVLPADWDRNVRYDSDGQGNEFPMKLNLGDEIVMGFDGAKTDDATALVAIRLRDKMAFPIAIWQRPHGLNEDWEVSIDEIEAEVFMAFRNYKVLAFYADVQPWESYVNAWSETFGSRLVIKASGKSHVGFDMRNDQKRITRGNEALVAAIEDGRIFHNGDKMLRRHVLNARRKPNEFGDSFRKDGKHSPNKIDAYAALLLAYMAMLDLIESGKRPERTYTRRLVQA